ncbi:MAG: YybH family protein [Mycobacteriales bacterium]
MDRETHARWRSAALGVAALALLLTSATAAVPDAVSREATAAINAANAQWLPAMKRGDVAAIVAPYAEDAVFLTAKGEAVHGRAAIAELYRARLATVSVTGGDIVSQERVAATPDLIYEWGHASLVVVQKDGRRTQGGGPYLSVWRRDKSGHWLIIRNVVF